MNVRRIVLATAMSVASVGAGATAVPVNGGFESGLTGRNVTGTSAGSCDANFNVGTTVTASGCSGYSPITATFGAPASGSHAAYRSFDGHGADASIYLSDVGSGGTQQFDLYVPLSFTGPGIFTHDSVAVTPTVPEPASLALAGLALFGLALALRAKRR